MDGSILITIKKMLGITEDYDAFDTDIMVGINTAIMQLRQIGIGPQSEMFFVDGDHQSWYDLLGEDGDMEAAKTYVYLKVKTVFDPPTSSTVQQSYDALAKELEWRMYSQKENQNELERR